jgi:hypothetical protein
MQAFVRFVLIGLSSCAVLAGLTACGALDAGSPPRLSPIEDQRVVVGEKLSVLVTATDPDGDELTFKIQGRPSKAQFIAGSDGESALFTWIPEVTDADAGGRVHTVRFFVQDSNGEWDDQEVPITVFPQAAPSFLNPPGYVLNMAEESHIEFLVQVKDDSASQIDITIAEGPQGAYLEQSGKKKAYFYWKPTPEQLEQKLFWYVRFKAVGYAPDTAHPGSQNKLYELLHDVSIVIMNSNWEGCSGSPPKISHEVPADIHWQAGSAEPGYRIDASILENESYIAQANVLWTVGDPNDPEAYTAVAMTGGGTQAQTAHIPKVSAGAGRFVHYYIEAWDNDDYAGTACDHVARLPKQGFFTLVVYDSGYESTCMEDVYEQNDTFAAATVLPYLGSYGGLRLCGGGQDYFAFSVLSPQADVVVEAMGNGHSLVTQVMDGAGNPVGGERTGSFALSVAGEKLVGGVVVLGTHSELGLPVTYGISVIPKDEACTPDSLEPNDASGNASSIGAGVQQGLTLCTGEVDWFRLQVPAGSFLSATLDHLAQNGDLDLYLVDADADTIMAAAETAGDKEVVTANVPSGGIRYLVVAGFAGSSNSYNLEVEFSTATEECQEDSLAPNQYPDEAVTLPPGGYKQLTLCPGKKDWFAIGLNGGEQLQVSASGSGVAVQLFLADGVTPLCSGSPQGGKSVASCSIPAAGDYRISVTGASGMVTQYDLEIQVTESPGPCTDDRFEENDGPGYATPLVQSATTWLKACGTDQDWFSFAGYAMETVLIAVLFESPSGDWVDATLYDESGSTPVAWTASQAGSPFLEYQLPQSGTWRILVNSGSYDVNLAYNLLIWIE